MKIILKIKLLIWKKNKLPLIVDKLYHKLESFTKKEFSLFDFKSILPRFQ